MMASLLVFEVLDKEPSITFFWVIFLPIAVLGSVLCRFHYLFIMLVLPVALLVGYVITSELRDSAVGPAIFAESKAYFLQAYFGWGLAVLAPCISAFLKFRKTVLFQERK